MSMIILKALKDIVILTILTVLKMFFSKRNKSKFGSANAIRHENLEIPATEFPDRGKTIIEDFFMILNSLQLKQCLICKEV